MRTLSSLLAVLLLTVPLVSLAQDAGQTFIVQVFTPDGTPKRGVTVTVEREGFRETAVTNATGHAVFRQLSEGVFTVSTSLQGVELTRTQFSFPETTRMNLTVLLSRFTVHVLDKGGRAVRDLTATVTSPTGVVSSAQRTNATGFATFSDLPYSSVERIGGAYTVKVLKKGVVVAEERVEVDSPLQTLTLTADLVNVNFTVSDVGGNRVAFNGQLSLTAGNYSESVEVVNGRASVTQVVGSRVVGPYNTTITMKVGIRDVVVYSSLLAVEDDVEFFLRAGVGAFIVKVIDSGGNPVKGVGLLVGAAGYGNFTSGTAGDDGTFNAGLLPLSNITGDYMVSVFRGRTRVQTSMISHFSSLTVGEVVLNIQRIAMRVLDYSGKPLDALVEVVDRFTGRSSAANTSNGVGYLEVFPGINDVKVTYKGRVVFNRQMDIAGDLDLRINSVNFPVTFKVLDSLGGYVQGLRIIVRYENSKILDEFTVGEPKQVILDVPGEVVVDLLSGDSLVVRERAFADGPTTVEVRLRGYVEVGGSLVPVTFMASAVLSALLVSLAGLTLYNLRRRKQR